VRLAKHKSQIMPRHGSFQDVPRLVLPVIVDFGNPNYKAGISHLQLFESCNLGRFLYFRFNERNWIPKKALNQYNREWTHHQLVLHQARDTKWIFFRIRDSTQQNFLQGLADIINVWLSDTISGQYYRLQYSNRRRIYDQAVAQAMHRHELPPRTPNISIATTRFHRGPSRVPNRMHQALGIPDPTYNNAAAPAPGADEEENERPLLFLNRYLPFFNAFVRRPVCVKHAWRYNLEFVDESLRKTWNAANPTGNPPVPLFEGLTKVVADLAPAMLTHVL